MNPGGTFAVLYMNRGPPRDMRKRYTRHVAVHLVIKGFPINNGGMEVKVSDINKRAWNQMADDYQKAHRVSTSDIHYGYMSAGEKRLNLLGDITDRKVIDLGCGSGENSVALSKMGAKVTGIDISERQIEKAYDLSRKERVAIDFLIMDMEDLSFFKNCEFDIAFSSHSISYVKDFDHFVQQVHRILKDQGTFIFCELHPILYSLFDAIEEKDISKTGDYFEEGLRYEKYECKDPHQPEIVTLYYHRKVSTILNSLILHGFEIERVIEPRVMAMGDSTEDIPFYCDIDDSEKHKMQRKLPFDIIIKCKKRGG